MTPEARRAAATAWAAMDPPSKLQHMLNQMAGEMRGPMAPGVALDYVQDATGDRDEAVMALLNAGADWLDTQTRPSRASDLDSACAGDADLVTSSIRGEALGLASTFLSHIEERCGFAAHPIATRLEKHTAHEWARWAAKARAALDRCEAIAAAAYPETPAGA